MKVKRYSLHGDSWEEELKDPLYILDAGWHKFSCHDKELNIDSTSYYLIYKHEILDDFHITIGDYDIMLIDGAYTTSKLNSYEEVNKIIPFKDYCIVTTVGATNVDEDKLIHILSKEFIKWNNQVSTYVTYINRIIPILKLCPRGLLGVEVMFNSLYDQHPIDEISRTTMDIYKLSYSKGNNIKLFKDYERIYRARITRILAQDIC